MEWLMGKARGVGRGLMNAAPSIPSPPDSAPLTTASALQRQSPTLDVLGDTKQQYLSSSIQKTTYSQPIPVTNACSGMIEYFSVASFLPADTSDEVLPSESDSVIKKLLDPCFLQKQLPVVKNTTITKDFPSLIQPLPSIDINEWIAAHTIGLFENMNTIFDAIYELCVCKSLDSWRNIENESLPVSTLKFVEDPDFRSEITSNIQTSMSNKTSYSARHLINIALSECSDILQSSSIFPIKPGQPFPQTLPIEAGKVCKKLLICLSHIYMSHFHHLQQLELNSHMNTLAKHFFSFTTHFNLIDDRDFGPLNEFHRALLLTPAPCLVDFNARNFCEVRTVSSQEVISSEVA